MSRPSGFKEACAVRTRVSKRGIPLKVVIYPLLACLAWKWLQIGTDMRLNITSTGEKLVRIVNIDDFDWPWTLKNRDVWWFLAILGCKSVNCDKMDGDRPRLTANMNCYRLSRVSWALAQVSCYVSINLWLDLVIGVCLLCFLCVSFCVFAALFAVSKKLL